jgi:hypothetical protein
VRFQPFPVNSRASSAARTSTGPEYFGHFDISGILIADYTTKHRNGLPKPSEEGRPWPQGKYRMYVPPLPTHDGLVPFAVFLRIGR